MRPRVMYDASVKNIIKLDDSVDKPYGKVFVVSNEIPVGIVPAAGGGVGYII
jgi:adenosyl cobinamide kinase/adenosyl cobinamide phosphate guanylyltransferase